MTKLLPTLTLAATLALLPGCATTASNNRASATPQGNTYFALGTEPFWTLEITPARLNFHGLDMPTIAVPNPGAGKSGPDSIYVTEAIAVRIVAGPCSDGMSDRRYADGVSVRLGNGPVHLSGCGGRVLPPEQLDGTSWRVISIDGSPPVAGRPAEFSFEGGRISGSAGCNRLSGSFASDGTRLTVGQVAATRMACEPALMAQEARVLAMLRQSLGISFDGRGRMVLSGGGGATMVLERIA